MHSGKIKDPPPRASGNEPAKVHPVAWNKMRNYVMELEKLVLSIIPKSSPDIIHRSSPGGVTSHLARRGGGASSRVCPFGQIISVQDESYTKAIMGGALLCGDQNFNVNYQGINLESDGTWLVEISLSGVDPATDDDDEIFLSGVITASGTPTWNLVSYTGTENYTPNTNPSTPAGTGTIVIPIGVLTITGGSPRLDPVACGMITVGQCAGILSHTRG